MRCECGADRKNRCDRDRYSSTMHGFLSLHILLLSGDMRWGRRRYVQRRSGDSHERGRVRRGRRRYIETRKSGTGYGTGDDQSD